MSEESKREIQEVSPDPLFEQYIAHECVGVQDSARSQYYGEAYDLLFVPVVTNPQFVGGRGQFIPMHTDAENQRAMEIIERFSDADPERANHYGYQI